MSLRQLYVAVMRILRRVFGLLGILRLLERSRKPAALHVRSMFSIYDSKDLAGLDLSWWTYGAMDRLEKFLAERDASVFEYGAGASTLWLAKRSRDVVGVEHDLEYVPVVAELTKGLRNVRLIAVEPKPGSGSAPSGRVGYEGMDFSEYVASIANAGGPFDLVVIDGRARVACVDAALASLKPGGIILFDDIKRRRYQPVLSRQDVSVELHRGFKPSIPFRDTTAILIPRK